MRLLNFFNIGLAILISLAFLLSEKVYAADLVTTTVATTLPFEVKAPNHGQVITSSSLTIKGTAPPGALITVTIQDEDYQNTFQAHEVNLLSNGTTTSDKNGEWIYIPATNLVPGRFSVVAAYQNANSGSISTDKIFFTVADNNGATSWFTIPGGTLIIILVLIIAFLVFVIFRVGGLKKKRRVFIHTSLGDIPAREIIDINDDIEVIPVSEQMLNLPVQPTYVAQPVLITQQPQFQSQQVVPTYAMPVAQVPLQQVQPQQPQVIQNPIINQPSPVPTQPMVQPTQSKIQNIQNTQQIQHPLNMGNQQLLNSTGVPTQ